MRFSRFLRALFLPLLAFLSLPAPPSLAQNLLVNPGFDRDLGGWTIATVISPNPSPLPGYVEATAAWSSSDAGGNALSGGVALHARADTMSFATTTLTQCAPVSEGMLVSFGGKFLTARQYMTAGAGVMVTFFSSADCSGASFGSATAGSLPSVLGPTETNSGGLWLFAASQAIASTGARSVLFEIDARATGTMAYGLSYVDAIADDVFLTAATAPLTTTLLPSAAWIHGAGGAYWTTRFTLVNAGATDAAVSLRFLPHDGGASREFTYNVPAGWTLDVPEETWEINFRETFGAILVTSPSPSVFLQSETSTFVPAGGTVGQALPAFGANDFAGSTPKMLAPIRENVSFRSNLVLANATSAPLTAHVALYASDGTLLGARDIDLPPLGMTQINRVASALGTTILDAGRLAISTPTPGGLVAAYASVIDNTTNDPRTLLPR